MPGRRDEAGVPTLPLSYQGNPLTGHRSPPGLITNTPLTGLEDEVKLLRKLSGLFPDPQ